jgi:hypothetical protein
MDLYARWRGEPGFREGSFKWHRLEDAGRQCGLAPVTLHRAHGDATLARGVLHHVASDGRFEATARAVRGG